MTPTLSARAERLRMPVRDALLGRSFFAAERQLFDLAGRTPGLTSLTHADTAAYPPPASAGPRYLEAIAAGTNPFGNFLGEEPVRAALAPRLSALLGTQIDADTELVITAGTQNALFTSLSLLIGAGDSVLVPDPDYMTIEKTVRYLGADVVHLPSRVHPESGQLEIGLDDIERGFAAGARLLVFSNPCNPTGTVYGEAFIAGVAELAVRYDAMVLVDELYARLVFDTGMTHVAAQPGMRERCITTIGTSKTESMSGFRVGCMVAPAALVDAVPDAVEVSALRPSTYAQYALLDWLEGDSAAMDERIALFARLHKQTVAAFEALPFMDLAVSHGTAYVFPRMRDPQVDDFVIAETLVRKAGVLVYPGISFGPGSVGGFRLCFAQEEAALPGLLDRVGTALAGLALR